MKKELVYILVLMMSFVVISCSNTDPVESDEPIYESTWELKELPAYVETAFTESLDKVGSTSGYEKYSSQHGSGNMALIYTDHYTDMYLNADKKSMKTVSVRDYKGLLALLNGKIAEELTASEATLAAVTEPKEVYEYRGLNTEPTGLLDYEKAGYTLYEKTITLSKIKEINEQTGTGEWKDNLNLFTKPYYVLIKVEGNNMYYFSDSFLGDDKITIRFSGDESLDNPKRYNFLTKR